MRGIMAKAPTFNNENDVKKRVNKLLTEHHWFWWSVPMNGFGKTGIADKAALRDGVFIAIECKFGSNKPTPLQKAYLQSIMSHGGMAFVVNEKNIARLEEWLSAFDRAKDAVGTRDKIADEDGATMLDCIAALTELIAAP